MPASFGIVLSLFFVLSQLFMSRFFLPQLAESLLRFLYIFKCELAGFNQVRHHRLRAPTEEREQIIDQLALRGITGNRRRENVEVPDLLDPAHSLYCFQSINGRDRKSTRLNSSHR